MVVGQPLRRSQRGERRGKRPLFAVENIESVVTVAACFAALALAFVALAAKRADAPGAGTKTVTHTVTVFERGRAETAPERVQPSVVADGGSAAAHPGPQEEVRYVVKPGDTLWAIASAHYAGDPRAAVAKIAARNGIEGGLLVPGEKLVLP